MAMNHIIYNKRKLKGHKRTNEAYRLKKLREKKITHGATIAGGYTKEYLAWQNMKKRCYDKKSKDYHNYGARGIKVCDEWLHDFSKFIEDVGYCQNKIYSFDSIDSNKNYTKDNCRWIDKLTQARNRSGWHKKQNNLQSD